MLRLPTLSERESSASEILLPPDSGFGVLRTVRGILPLITLDVQARLEGLLATLDIRQTFHNCQDEPLEATYIFPLPDRAAVRSFRLEVAGRTVVGELHERGKARRIYDQALQTGHRAAISEEERSGVFTLRVGNLPPGEYAKVHLKLVGLLPFQEGEVTFHFPLVVAPRYLPGIPLSSPPVGQGTSPDTSEVPDASRITPPVLLPGFRSPVDLRLGVEVIRCSLEPHDFRSSLHTVIEEQTTRGQRFRVLPGEKLDRDFLLRYRLNQQQIQSDLVLQPDESGTEGTFLLTLLPPRPIPSEAQPRALVFLLDRSGSMAGWKMVAARRALSRLVETLSDEDRFTLYAFDDRIETPQGFEGWSLVRASASTRYVAEEFLARIEARGGTVMDQPLLRGMEALNERAESAEEQILVLITDGQVGNEDALLRTLEAKRGKIRLFTLGIDRCVNAAFLRRLTGRSGGSSELVESEQRLNEVMDRIQRQIGTPVLTDWTLSAKGIRLLSQSLVPARLPDLFSGTPVLITGRYQGPSEGALLLEGKLSSGKRWQTEVTARSDPQSSLAAIWARGRIRDLEDQYVVERSERADLEAEIVQTSLRFQVLSRFTAFVAVDRTEIAAPEGPGIKVIQPVEAPSEWGRMDTQLAQAAPPAPGGKMGLSALRSLRQGNGVPESSRYRTRSVEPKGSTSSEWSSSRRREQQLSTENALEHRKTSATAKPRTREIEESLRGILREWSLSSRNDPAEVHRLFSIVESLLEELQSLVERDHSLSFWIEQRKKLREQRIGRKQTLEELATQLTELLLWVERWLQARVSTKEFWK